MPPPTVRQHLLAELGRLGLLALLGDALFPPSEWHQSLSSQFEDDPDLIERLRGVGPKILARAPRFKIDRVESARGPDGVVHWAFKSDQPPADFAPLLGSLRAAISMVDGRKQIRNKPHVTISY